MTNFAEYVDAREQINRWNKIRDDAAERLLKSHFAVPRELVNRKTGMRYTSANVLFNTNKSEYVLEVRRVNTIKHGKPSLLTLNEIITDYYLL